MNLIQPLATSVTTLAAAIVATAFVVLDGLHRRVAEQERGDVPGWVLITLMTAGLVTILWKLAGDQLAALFTQAISSVTGP